MTEKNPNITKQEVSNMMYSGAQVSESRQYVACTSEEVLVRFLLPEGVLVNSVVHAGYYFRKYLNPGETVLWMSAYENVKFMPDVENLPVVYLEEGRRVETPIGDDMQEAGVDDIPAMGSSVDIDLPLDTNLSWEVDE